MAKIEPINAQTEQIELKRRTPDEHIKYLAGVVLEQIVRIAELEKELAPIRALPVGSWQWAMLQFLLGRQVVDRHGTKYRFDVRNADHTEPFRLFTEPPPAPTADDLCAAIEGWENSTTDAYSWHCRNMKKLAAAYRAANAKGVCPDCGGDGKGDGGIGGDNRCRTCRGSGKANAKGGA